MINTSNTDIKQDETPQALSFPCIDWFKVLWELIFAFRQTYSIAPGLYYTGVSYDITAPLLVTSNYHLTVWSVWRRIKHLKTRILVIDTDGINVWCSAGKGRFCAEEIVKQIKRYPRELLSQGDEIPVILPKLALSGIKLTDLRKHQIKPVIGPVYASSLPAYLSHTPYRDCKTEYFEFDLADRIFTLPSTWMQITLYSVSGAVALGLLNLWLQTGIWWQIVPMSLVITTLYIWLFPYLPTKSFVYKGISLFIGQAIGYAVINPFWQQQIPEAAFYLSYMAGFSIFFGLYYTGNSGVSNYSIVKKETVMFLPVVVLLFAAALVAVLVKGGLF